MGIGMTKRREIPLFATRRTEGVRRKKPGRFVRNDGWGGAVYIGAEAPTPRSGHARSHRAEHRKTWFARQATEATAKIGCATRIRIRLRGKRLASVDGRRVSAI